MVANTGPQQTTSSASASSSESESAEGPSAVATMTRLIHDLYASKGSYAAIRGGRDSDLIDWSEMLGVVRDRERATNQ
jgi:hypothetical protein